MKRALLIGSLAAMLFLTSCSSFPEPEQVAEAIRPGLEYLQSKDILDGDQVEAVMAIVVEGVRGVFEKATSIWDDILKMIGTAAGTLTAGYFGIKKWRGSPMERKGIAPEATP